MWVWILPLTLNWKGKFQYVSLSSHLQMGASYTSQQYLKIGHNVAEFPR